MATKICIVCNQPITSGQSSRGTGLGWVHTFCVFPKKVVVEFQKKAPKPGYTQK